MPPGQTPPGLVVNDGLVDLETLPAPPPADPLLPAQPPSRDQLGCFDSCEPLGKSLNRLDEIPNVVGSYVQLSFSNDLDH